MGERGRTNNSYPEELKMQAVKLVTEGNRTERWPNNLGFEIRHR